MSDIETTSTAVQDTTSVQNAEQNVTPEQELHTAFDSLLSQYEGRESTEEKTTVEDTSESTVTQDVTTAQQDQLTSPTDNAASEQSGTPANTDGSDYRQVVDKLIQDKDNHIQLLYSRLNELSSEYQNIKQQTAAVGGNQTPVQDELPKEIKELQEIYPEIASAVDKMIEMRVKGTSEVIEKKVADVVQPIAQQVRQAQEQQTVNMLLAKHPDLPEIVRDNSLVKWASTLDPVSQRGAQYVIQYGTVDEVLALVDQFKSSMGRGAPATNSIPQQVTSTTVNQQQTQVNKLLSALTAPSNKQEPNVYQQQAKEKYSTTDEAFAALAKEYERDNRRY